MTGCCREGSCRRRKPILLLKSAIAEPPRWYFVTGYNVAAGGTPHVTAREKHDATEQVRGVIGEVLSRCLDGGCPRDKVDAVAAAFGLSPKDSGGS